MSNDIKNVKPLIDFTPDDKKNYQKQKINDVLTLEEALNKGFLVSGLEVMAQSTISDSCYYEPWNKEIGNIKDNDVMYANSQVAIEHPELSKYVTNTVGLFAGRKDESIDISQHDFSNVWNTDSMFKDCHNVMVINLGNNTFPKNIDAAHMFENCYMVRRIKGIENMDVSKVLSLNSCFKNCENIARLNLKEWCTPFLEDMSYCWYDCKSLSYLQVDNFDTSICKNVESIVGGKTLPQLIDAKRLLMKMTIASEGISRDDEDEYKNSNIDDRLKNAEKIKIQKYEESPILLALALKVAKNIKEMDYSNQESILNALHLSQEDFELLDKTFLKKEFENINVKDSSLNEIADDLEEIRELDEIDF